MHTAFGPGLFEKTYHVCMVHELKKDGLHIESEVVLPVVYDGIKIDAAYRVDMRVQNKVLVEIKAVEKLADIHTAQMLTYLQLSGIRVGLILNFNVVHLIDGIKRVICVKQTSLYFLSNVASLCGKKVRTICHVRSSLRL